MKLKVGDSLHEPLSGNNGEVLKIVNHPDGKIVTIRWYVEDHLAHEGEFFLNKLVKCIRQGEIEHSPGPGHST